MLTDALGAPLVRELGGTSYTFAQITQQLRTVFEQYITECCFQTLQAARGKLPEQTYGFLLGQHYEKLAQGAYDLFGSIGRAFLAEDRHAVHWLWVFLSKHQPQLTKDAVQELFDAYPEDCFRILVELVSKKNYPRPTSGLPTDSSLSIAT